MPVRNPEDYTMPRLLSSALIVNAREDARHRAAMRKRAEATMPVDAPEGWAYAGGPTDDDRGMTEADAIASALGMAITFGDSDA
jgi:hypothetical protein